ncbi:TPA: hypothetical protein PXP39_003754 [Yersinia enterocolitica]|nr:hypothetical protein [Yersinia enterocolitica]HDL7833818.1 hypothetical protein [Yersinia enterocolitica]HDL7874724.1 hypothetical protein [Yersinia enterocolitica]HDL7887053.1 hypothetical protein [Yersinia enterocolitica]HDL7895913.1 hypothetical protein [Yersinia enterocolitica]
MTSVKSKLQVAIVLAVTVIVYAAIVIVGMRGWLNGNFDQYLVPGSYAAPQNISAHGFENKVFPKMSAGWDGQFYYYHADDPLLLKDTASHLDMPDYRTKRVGVPAIAYVLSRMSGQDWTSPKFYFSVTVGLQIIATYMMAMFLYDRGYSPCISLIWSISGSALYTVAFGFIDGSADALLLISLIFYAKDKIIEFIFFMSLAALSKESYIVVPLSLIIAQIIHYSYIYFYKKNDFNILIALKGILINSIPLVIIFLWFLYLHLHLNTDSLLSKSGVNMVASPFSAFYTYIIAGINGETLTTLRGMEQHFPPYRLLIGLVIFLFIILSIIISSLSIVASEGVGILENKKLLGMVISVIGISSAYTCLGETQLWEPVGFVKAISLVVGLFIILLPISKKRFPPVLFLLALSFCIYSVVVVSARIGNEKFTHVVNEK